MKSHSSGSSKAKTHFQAFSPPVIDVNPMNELTPQTNKMIFRTLNFRVIFINNMINPKYPAIPPRKHNIKEIFLLSKSISISSRKTNQGNKSRVANAIAKQFL